MEDKNEDHQFVSFAGQGHHQQIWFKTSFKILQLTDQSKGPSQTPEMRTLIWLSSSTLNEQEKIQEEERMEARDAVEDGG